MTSDSRGEPWYDGDHVEGGFKVLEVTSQSRADVWTASAGYSDAWEPQVLVLGTSHIEILTGDGELLLDVGYREVRAVRLVQGSGVEVCVTGMGPTSLRPKRWMHRLSDVNARYIEQSWLDSSPFIHSGTQLNSLPWREEEYAYYVGRAVTEASRCDVSLAALVLTARELLEKPPEGVYGQSGKPLADAIEDLGRYNPAFVDIGQRYRAWYLLRNFATHGTRGWDAAGRPTGQVFKAKRPTGKAPEYTVEIEDQDFSQLALLWRAFYALNHDAMAALYFISRPGASGDLLAQLPMPNTVSASERMPSGTQPGQSAP